MNTKLNNIFTVEGLLSLNSIDNNAMVAVVLDNTPYVITIKELIDFVFKSQPSPTNSELKLDVSVLKTEGMDLKIEVLDLDEKVMILNTELEGIIPNVSTEIADLRAEIYLELEKKQDK